MYVASSERIHVLDVAACYELLRTDTVGRIVYTQAALPAVRPITYSLDGHHIVFRTRPDSALAHSVSGQVVAFEVDQLDRETRTGWSVVVTGVAEPLESPSDLARAAGLQLAPWAGGERELFLSITPGLVTGRRIG